MENTAFEAAKIEFMKIIHFYNQIARNKPEGWVSAFKLSRGALDTQVRDLGLFIDPSVGKFVPIDSSWSEFVCGETALGHGAKGDGTTDDRAALAAADAAAGSTGKVILGSGKTYRVSSDLTFTACVDIQVGSMLSIDADVTVTFENYLPVAGRWQIFTGPGKPAFVGKYEVVLFPEWWGAIGDETGGVSTTDRKTELQKMIDDCERSGGPGCTVLFGNGCWGLSTTLTFDYANGVSWKWIGVNSAGNTRFDATTGYTGAGPMFDLTDGPNFYEFHDIYLSGNYSTLGVSAPSDGIEGNNVRRSIFSRVRVEGMRIAGLNIGGYYNKFIECRCNLNNGHGFYFRGSGNNFNVNMFSCNASTNEGFGFFIVDALSLNGYGCSVEANKEGGVYISSSKNITWQGGHFEGNGKTGVKFTTAGQDGPHVRVHPEILIGGGAENYSGTMSKSFPAEAVAIDGAHFTNLIYRALDYDGLTGGPLIEIGEGDWGTVEGDNSGETADIKYVTVDLDDSSKGILHLSNITGDFEDNEGLSFDSPSTASALADGTLSAGGDTVFIHGVKGAIFQNIYDNPSSTSNLIDVWHHANYCVADDVRIINCANNGGNRIKLRSLSTTPYPVNLSDWVDDREDFRANILDLDIDKWINQATGSADGGGGHIQKSDVTFRGKRCIELSGGNDETHSWGPPDLYFNDDDEYGELFGKAVWFGAWVRADGAASVEIRLQIDNANTPTITLTDTNWTFVWHISPITTSPIGFSFRKEAGDGLNKIYIAEPVIAAVGVPHREFFSENIPSVYTGTAEPTKGYWTLGEESINRSATGASDPLKWFVRRAGFAAPKWSVGATFYIGDVVVPTTDNGYYYVAELTIDYDGLTGGPLAASGAVTGGTSGTTATIEDVVVDSSTEGTLYLSGICGTFQDNETLSFGDTSSASSLINGTYTASGTTGVNEPAFPTGSGATFTGDGTVNWRRQDAAALFHTIK